MIERLLDTQEVREILGRSKASFTRDRASGNCPRAVIIGGSTMFRSQDIQKFIEACLEPA